MSAVITCYLALWRRIRHPAGNDVDGFLLHADVAVIMERLARIAAGARAAVHHDQLFHRGVLHAPDDETGLVGTAVLARVFLVVHDEHRYADAVEVERRHRARALP